MPRKKIDYAERMAKIAKFTTFSYKNPNRLCAKNKAKITRAYNLIGELSPTRRFIPIKSEGKREKANNIFGAEVGNKDRGLLRGVFVPESVIGARGRLVQRGKNIAIVNEFAEETYIEFDNQRLAKYTEAYLDKALPEPQAQQNLVVVTVNAELQDVALSDKKQAIDAILKLLNDYSPNAAGTMLNNGKNLNHAIGKQGWRGEGWLVGVKLQERKNQK